MNVCDFNELRQMLVKNVKHEFIQQRTNRRNLWERFVHLVNKKLSMKKTQLTLS